MKYYEIQTHIANSKAISKRRIKTVEIQRSIFKERPEQYFIFILLSVQSITNSSTAINPIEFAITLYNIICNKI